MAIKNFTLPALLFVFGICSSQVVISDSTITEFSAITASTIVPSIDYEEWVIKEEFQLMAPTMLTIIKYKEWCLLQDPPLKPDFDGFFDWITLKIEERQR